MFIQRQNCVDSYMTNLQLTEPQCYEFPLRRLATEHRLQVLLYCCAAGVAVLLHCCAAGAAVLLHCCAAGAAVLPALPMASCCGALLVRYQVKHRVVTGVSEEGIRRRERDHAVGHNIERRVMLP